MSDWYTGRTGRAPWDIGRHQPILEQWYTDQDIRGNVVDVGCGTGENALYIAEQGIDILGLDLSPTAIKEAQQKAKERGLAGRTRFEVQDIFEFNKRQETFDSIIDTGLLHNFETSDKKRLVTNLGEQLTPGGSYLVLGFNENEPLGRGPPNRIYQRELDDLFSDGWTISYVKETVFLSNISTDGHKAFAIKVVRS